MHLPNESQAESHDWMACLAARAFIGEAAFWHPEPRGRVKPRLRRVSWLRHAAVAIVRCFSLSKSHPNRLFATYVRSASTLNHGSVKVSCNFMRRAPPTGGSNRSCY